MEAKEEGRRKKEEKAVLANGCFFSLHTSCFILVPSSFKSIRFIVPWRDLLTIVTKMAMSSPVS
jgi:hypothetical protein